jgi:hypothetical protein
MYCVNCGTPLAPGLSYCNRCGSNLRERPPEPSKTASITAFLTAITLLGIAGMGIMLGGSVVLRREAGLAQEMIGFFMLFIFLIVVMTEFMLVRNLSKLLGSHEKKEYLLPPQPMPHELHAARPGSLGEPVSSVTENTTRTLEYSRRER